MSSDVIITEHNYTGIRDLIVNTPTLDVYQKDIALTWIHSNLKIGASLREQLTYRGCNYMLGIIGHNVLKLKNTAVFFSTSSSNT